MIKGLGCDIVSISRIRRKLETPRFAGKVFTAYEQQVIAAKGADTAAGLWAAKEAVSKALGTGFVGFAMPDIEVLHRSSGQPCIQLHAGALDAFQALGAQTVHITISHDGDSAMAVAIAE